jgi:hypothetical protein
MFFALSIKFITVGFSTLNVPIPAGIFQLKNQGSKNGVKTVKNKDGLTAVAGREAFGKSFLL